MAEFKCEHCGMGVKGLNCSGCDAELVHDHITKDDGSQIGIAKCPNGCGKIKSPMCGGADMGCSI